MKGPQLGESPAPEVVEISVSEGDAHDDPQDAVEGLDEPIGNALDEVVEDLVPPIAECGDELGQVFVAGPPGFENPGGEESLGLAPIMDFLEDAPEFLLEEVQGSKLGARIEQIDQPGFLGS